MRIPGFVLGLLRKWPFLLALLLVGLIGEPCGRAWSHFLLNLNVRVFHVAHMDDGFRIYLRLPTPYLLADRLGPVGADGLPAPAPFTTNAMEDDRLVHYLDPDALKADPLGLGRIAAEGHQVTVDGKRLIAEVEKVRIHSGGSEPSFASIEDAMAAFRVPADMESLSGVYVGDTIVDIVLRYRVGGPVYAYHVSSTLDPGLDGQEETANLLLDHFPGETKVFRARGLLADPIVVSRSPLSALSTFITEGIRHILEGWDHVLFVLCLVLGAARFSSLLWRVTGFTIGHSVTLAVGFFGFVPSGDWFVPAVETGIALSIIYAAVIAVRGRGKAVGSERSMFVITAVIGLLHGLGFSFVLHEILRVDSPKIWQSLLAFNLGVELGQLLIVVLAWPLFRLLARWSDRAWQAGRWGVAVPCVLIAAIWAGQRAIMVFQAL